MTLSCPLPHVPSCWSSWDESGSPVIPGLCRELPAGAASLARGCLPSADVPNTFLPEGPQRAEALFSRRKLRAAKRLLMRGARTGVAALAQAATGCVEASGVVASRQSRAVGPVGGKAPFGLGLTNVRLSGPSRKRSVAHLKPQGSLGWLVLRWPGQLPYVHTAYPATQALSWFGCAPCTGRGTRWV